MFYGSKAHDFKDLAELNPNRSLNLCDVGELSRLRDKAAAPHAIHSSESHDCHMKIMYY